MPANPHVAAVRGFNRFYTRQIGLLREGLLDSPFSLTQVRVLYELAHGKDTASEIARELALDAGYLSRILRAFEKRRYLTRTPSRDDARQSRLRLTPPGRREFAKLDRAANQEIASLLARLSPRQQDRLSASMRAIESLIAPRDEAPTAAFTIRSHKPGDIGSVIHLHGELYFREYGWDERFEALVAEIAAKFIQHLDPQHERCWIAEKDGAVVGSVFLVKQSARVAKLRLLIVDPSARGLGIGKRLVYECIQFAWQSGYRTITLWTQPELHAARHIYESAGFHLVREEPHAAFGIPMTGQIWELQRRGALGETPILPPRRRDAG